jgi:DnaA family protein
LAELKSQLSLPVSIKETETFDSFVQGQNSQLCQSLMQLPKDPSEQWLTYFFSDAEAGKSHLLYALCHLAEQSACSSIYLSGAQFNVLPAEALLGLEQYSIICIDDVHLIDGLDEWQVALFDLINRVKERDKGCIVLTGNQPVKDLPISLPDLKSRLSWGLSFQLKSLNDEQRQTALQIRADLRGLNMPKEVAKFLVTHWQRDMSSLLDSLDKLDEQSLSQQRRLTIPFVKSILYQSV